MDAKDASTLCPRIRPWLRLHHRTPPFEEGRARMESSNVDGVAYVSASNCDRPLRVLSCLCSASTYCWLCTVHTSSRRAAAKPSRRATWGLRAASAWRVEPVMRNECGSCVCCRLLRPPALSGQEDGCGSRQAIALPHLRATCALCGSQSESCVHTQHVPQSWPRSGATCPGSASAVRPAAPSASMIARPRAAHSGQTCNRS